MAEPVASKEVQVLILGTNLIGRRWFQVFLESPVVTHLYLYDDHPGFIRAESMVEKAKLSKGGSTKKYIQAWKYRGWLETHDLDFIVDARETEDFAEIRKILEFLEKEYLDEWDEISFSKIPVIVSSSTRFSPEELFNGLKTILPYGLVAHPVQNTPLVELVIQPKLKETSYQEWNQLLLDSGQETILLAEHQKGLLVKRLEYVVLTEAMRLIQSGTVTASDLDKAIKKGLAPLWCLAGPIQNMANQSTEGTILDYCTKSGDQIRDVIDTVDCKQKFKKSAIVAMDKLVKENRNVVEDQLPDLLSYLQLSEEIIETK